jgi:hypothetical protein
MGIAEAVYDVKTRHEQRDHKHTYIRPERMIPCTTVFLKDQLIQLFSAELLFLVTFYGHESVTGDQILTV